MLRFSPITLLPPPLFRAMPCYAYFFFFFFFSLMMLRDAMPCCYFHASDAAMLFYYFLHADAASYHAFRFFRCHAMSSAFSIFFRFDA